MSPLCIPVCPPDKCTCVPPPPAMCVQCQVALAQGLVAACNCYIPERTSVS